MKVLFTIFLVFYSMMSVAAEQAPAPAPATTTPPAATAPVATTAPATPQSATPAVQSQAESIGQVIWAKGQVSAVLPNQTKRALARKDTIYKEDTLESEKASTAQINFTDGTILAIGEKTTLVLNKYQHNKAKPSEDSYVMSLTKGSLRTVTGEIAKSNPSGYAVKTPVATLSVAGTQFAVAFSDGINLAVQAIKNKVKVVTLKGDMKVLNALDQKYVMVNGKTNEFVNIKTLPTSLQEMQNIQLQKVQITKPVGRVGGGVCFGAQGG